MHLIVINGKEYLKKSGKHETTPSLHEAREFPTKKQGERAVSRLLKKSELVIESATLILKPAV